VIFLFVATFHSLLLVSYQASLKARQTAIAETIRGSCTLVLMFLPVAFRWQVSETYYWNAWMTAYLLSFGFMVYCLRGNTYFGTERQFAWDRYRSDLLDAIRFGWPFTLWVLFSFLLAYADRWYLARSGLSINQSADYLALADSVFRGCGFLFVPLNTAGYPVISKVFDSGDMKATYKLIIKVVKTELLLLAAVIIGLLLFHTFIFNLLGISTGTLSTNIALLALLAFTHGLWQTCSMLQKPAELKMKTGWLAVGNAFGTLIVYGLFFVIVRPQQPLGIVLCLAAGILSYVCFVGVLLFRFVRAQRD
jgi:O-antigen/teichoic acid export membrane protein